MSETYVEPDWPAPPGIHALTTLRCGGLSSGPYRSFNLAMHVGDDPRVVGANRRHLRAALRLPAEPCWLQQTHGSTAIRALCSQATVPPEADASYTDEPGVVCVVMTADCLPVLFCNREGTRVAAAHAGWRGLANGVLETTVAALGPTGLMAWLGPAIGPKAFEVGPPVRLAFLQRLGECDHAFQQIGESRWLADLYGLAKMCLIKVGVNQVYGGNYCTYSEPERFFSYRRDGQTGRMATLIWRE